MKDKHQPLAFTIGVLGWLCGPQQLGAMQTTQIQAQESWRGPRVRVGVLDLSGSALQMQTASTATGTTSTTVQLPAPADFARGLTQLLTTALTKEERFIVLERAQLDKVTAEQDLGASGRVTAETAAALSKTLGAQALVSGDITEFSYSQSGLGSKLKLFKEVNKQIGAKVDRVTAQVAIDIRVIDAATGEVMHSVRGEGKASSTGVAADLTTDEKELAAGGTVQTPLGKASRQAIERAVAGIVDGIRKVPWSGRVVEVRGTQVYINGGTKLGIQEGMEFDVFSPNQTLVDPETGATLGAPDQRTGRIAVTKVTEKYAVARILEGQGFKRNDLVRFKGALDTP